MSKNETVGTECLISSIVAFILFPLLEGSVNLKDER